MHWLPGLAIAVTQYWSQASSPPLFSSFTHTQATHCHTNSLKAGQATRPAGTHVAGPSQEGHKANNVQVTTNKTPCMPTSSFSFLPSHKATAKAGWLQYTMDSWPHKAKAAENKVKLAWSQHTHTVRGLPRHSWLNDPWPSLGWLKPAAACPPSFLSLLSACHHCHCLPMPACLPATA